MEAEKGVAKAPEADASEKSENSGASTKVASAKETLTKAEAEMSKTDSNVSEKKAAEHSA